MPIRVDISENQSPSGSGIAFHQEYSDPLSSGIVTEMQIRVETSENQSPSGLGIAFHQEYSDPLSSGIVTEMPIRVETSENPTKTNCSSTAGPKDGTSICASNQIHPMQKQEENSVVTLHTTSADSGFTFESSECDSVGAQKDYHDTKTVMETVIEIPSSHLQLKKEINKGAFGVVWKAVWNETIVAVKKIPVKRLKKCKHLLDRELKINASIRHPNLVLFMGYNIEGNELQLVTEYINGFNLDQVLFDDLGIDLPLEKRLPIGYQISAAVAYLRSRNPVILHRDIKPENVVLSKCMGIAKLCDMGLSKFKSFTTAITTVAGGCGTQPGTLVYKAPEVCLLNESASKATDVWSLCATLVELLSDELIREESNDTDKDERSFDKYMYESMQAKKQPDALKRLEDKELTVGMKDVLSNGFNYKPVARPSAIHICQVFRASLED